MADAKHNFSGTEIKAGLMVIVSVVLAVGFVLVTLGFRPPEEGKVFYAKWENTGGLNEGADVRFGGVKVGRVVEIVPDPDDQSLLVLRLDRKMRWEDIAHIFLGGEPDAAAVTRESARLRKRFAQVKSVLREKAQAAGLTSS